MTEATSKKFIPGTRITDLTGKVFTRLTVMTYAGKDRHGKTRWECLCSCPDATKVVVVGSDLNSGHSQSCGCLSREAAAERAKGRNTTHGLRSQDLYGTWGSMVSRCHNPNHRSYPKYGGRGITVCDEWRGDAAAFIKYMSGLPGYGEPGRSMDRIKNSLGYFPGNVRWATPQEQAVNRDTNVRLDFRGVEMCASEWSHHLGLRPSTLTYRIRRGWTPERALTEGVAPERLAATLAKYLHTETDCPETQESPHGRL